MLRPSREESAIAQVLMAGNDVHEDFADVEQDTKDAFEKRLTGPRSGHVYTTYFFTNHQGQVVPYGVRPPHQASAPGEPPAFDTGYLLRHIFVESRRTIDGASLFVGSTADYGPYLEKGTSRMKPRPFFLPTIMQDVIPSVRQRTADGIVRRERMKARQLGGRG